MPETRDPAIKLFGKTIALLSADDDGGGGGGDREEDKGHLTEETTTASKYREEENPESEENREHTSSPADDNHKHSSDDQETAPEEEEEEGQTDASSPLLKKPDKILPCPRCNSLDTKFCYYNNYNVNQPRHFCKNCQRYWTAGGAMRNVPVGAGRRRNKNPAVAPLYRHSTVSDVDLQAVAGFEQTHHPPLKSTGSVLSFGSDAPFCDTTASVLNLPEKAMNSRHRNGLHRAEEQPSVSSVSCDGAGGNVNEQCIRTCQSFSPQIPWPFHPAAAAYWGCAPWSSPWLSSPTSPSPLRGGSSVSVPDSPALGKHSREEYAFPGESSSGRHRLWIPKTLRIHDPKEAAKSSVWAMMDFESDETEGCRGIFGGFRTKGELGGTRLGEASRALHANPAALLRSINFVESSQVYY